MHVRPFDGAVRPLATAAIAAAIMLSGSLWLRSDSNAGSRSPGEVADRPAEARPWLRGARASPVGPVLFYLFDSYGCPSRGRPRLILYADGSALSTGPFVCEIGAHPRRLKLYQLGAARVRQIMRRLDRLGLFQHPPVVGYQPSISDGETVYIQAIWKGRAFSTTGYDPPGSLRVSLAYLQEVINALEGGVLYRPPGYLVQFRFNTSAESCDAWFHPLPWLVEDVDLDRLRHVSDRIVLPPKYARELRKMTPIYTGAPLEGPVCDTFWWRPLYPHE